jgi:hypothetical protein
VSLLPSEASWAWIAGAPSMTNAPNSNLFFGEDNPYVYDESSLNSVVQIKSSNQNTLSYLLKSFNLQNSTSKTPK